MYSDPDTYSDSSNYSPTSSQSSPYQDVSIYTMKNDNAMHVDGGPILEIIEQPQDHFRFRYKSEMGGTHGCLLGRNYTTSNKTKTYPTVQLQGYNKGRAVIKCSLAQFNNNNTHPHALEDDNQCDDVSRDVTNENQYTAKFQGMGIIHNAKRDVPTLLYRKYVKEYGNKPFNTKGLRTKCEEEAKNINLNIVRLIFTAYDEENGNLICPPVYSEAIYNLKSAATNDLKICRMSRVAGRAKGGDDVFIFVEKVNKKNIDIRFVEKSKHGEILWISKGIFTQNDVHHQYGIVFKTPAYRNTSTNVDVKVQVELFRPSDNRSSDPIEFIYKASHQTIKKRKIESCSSIESSSGASIKSISELPISVVASDKHISEFEEYEMKPNWTYMPHRKRVDEPLAEALYLNVIDPKNVPISQPNVPKAPVITVPDAIQINSEEFEKMMELGPKLESSEMRDLFNQFADDFKSNSFAPTSDTDSLSMDLFRSSMKLVPDSAKKKTPTAKKEPRSVEKLYSSEDAVQIKKLLLEICDMIQNENYNLPDIKEKLREIFDIRSINGDTCLTMALKPKLVPIFRFIVRILQELNMTDYLNLTNINSESILHYIIKNDLVQHINCLVSKGCDPMLENKKGENAIHYCIQYQTGLAEMLSALKKYNIKCDINAYNDDKKTPLHIAVENNSEASCRLLLKAGADTKAKDSSGRTPLHLAAFGDHLDVVEVLLEFTPKNEVDLTDGTGYTALQIVCDIPQQKNSNKIAKLLLDHGATPVKCENNQQSAWKIVSEKSKKSPSYGNLKDLLQEYLPADYEQGHIIKVEPDDEFESAEEWESDVDLRGMVLYIDELSELLDRSGRWRELARRLKCDSLLNWYENTPSPTRTLFSQIKEMGEGYTSRSLAITLNNMGDKEAANVILRYIDS